MSQSIISDTRIRIVPTEKLLKFISDNICAITEIPEGVALALRSKGYPNNAVIETLQNGTTYKGKKMNKQLIAKFYEELDKQEEKTLLAEKKHNSTITEVNKESNTPNDQSIYFYLAEIRWLNNFFSELRKNKGIEVYLHTFIEKCKLELPENDVIERNPILEARCQKLREEQQNIQYRKMTKNVDATFKNYPEDTIAYQMKAINGQIIAVLQFVFSVIAGFVFGFLGIELIVGNLDFGLRLLLGIMFALIIALAEIYFLAKKLNEFDVQTDTPVHKQKSHVD